jgi:hypothetical protein
MTKTKSHLTLSAILVTVTMVVAGSMAIAGNKGFKLNKGLTPRLGSSTGQVGFNWVSLPNFNSYPNFAAFCAQTGLVSTGITRATITKIDTVTAVATVATCGTAQAALPSASIVAGQGIRITDAGTGAPTSIIITGSHDPALKINVVAKSPTGPAGVYWFAVPYHTTAVTKADLCLSAGLASTGLNRGIIANLKSDTGATLTASCGTAAASSPVQNFSLGEAVRLQNPTAVSFIPAHF